MSERIVIALSGVVGAGKSSVASAIVRELQAAGCPAARVRFQDFIGARADQRKTLDSRPEGEEAAGPAQASSPPRWLGYQRRRLTPFVATGHAFRTLLFRWRIRQWPGDTVLVFDRYFYDSLVHLDSSSAGGLFDLLLRTIPVPTISAFLLIRESTILERRPQYSKEYAHQVSDSYRLLADRFPRAVVARTDDFDAIPQLVDAIVAGVLGRPAAPQSGR